MLLQNRWWTDAPEVGYPLASLDGPASYKLAGRSVQSLQCRSCDDAAPSSEATLDAAFVSEVI